VRASSITAPVSEAESSHVSLGRLDAMSETEIGESGRGAATDASSFVAPAGAPPDRPS
jgi:hypothetical protein